jgi:hypothetical protein
MGIILGVCMHCHVMATITQWLDLQKNYIINSKVFIKNKFLSIINYLRLMQRIINVGLSDG